MFGTNLLLRQIFHSTFGANERLCQTFWCMFGANGWWLCITQCVDDLFTDVEWHRHFWTVDFGVFEWAEGASWVESQHSWFKSNVVVKQGEKIQHKCCNCLKNLAQLLLSQNLDTIYLMIYLAQWIDFFQLGLEVPLIHSTRYLCKKYPNHREYHVDYVEKCQNSIHWQICTQWYNFPENSPPHLEHHLFMVKHQLMLSRFFFFIFPQICIALIQVTSLMEVSKSLQNLATCVVWCLKWG